MLLLYCSFSITILLFSSTWLVFSHFGHSCHPRHVIGGFLMIYGVGLYIYFLSTVLPVGHGRGKEKPFAPWFSLLFVGALTCPSFTLFDGFSGLVR